jgi:hypothetical protein
MVRLEGLGTLKQLNYLIGTLTSDLPAYAIAPQPSTLPREQFVLKYEPKWKRNLARPLKRQKDMIKKN